MVKCLTEKINDEAIECASCDLRSECCPYSDPCPIWKCEHEGHCDIWRPPEPRGLDFRPVKDETLADAFPELSKEWHPTKNGSLKPEDVKVKSRRKIWWICRVDDAAEGKRFTYEWKETIRKRLKPDGCPPFSATGWMPMTASAEELPADDGRGR